MHKIINILVTIIIVGITQAVYIAIYSHNASQDVHGVGAEKRVFENGFGMIFMSLDKFVCAESTLNAAIPYRV